MSNNQPLTKEEAMTKSAPQKSTLLMAMELSESKWKLGLGTASKVRRLKEVPYGDLKAVGREIEMAKRMLGLRGDTHVVACYEAGRDGYWIKRALEKKLGIECKMVDSASIEVSRRKRRPKNDKLDVKRLLRLLARDVLTEEEDIWSVCRVPNEEQEEARRPHRELERLKMEGTGHRSRIKSLLALHGIKSDLRVKWGEQIEGLRDYKGAELGPHTRAELKREWERLQVVQRQIKEIEEEQEAMEEAKKEEAAKKNVPLRTISPTLAKIEQLRQLKGINRSARTLTYEFFGWRTFKNGREVGGAAGLTPTPFSSGATERELGISKAGNRRIRSVMIELAWSWERYQPESKLTKWFQKKFGKQGPRRRRIGIVALARKLLVALWRYLETGVIPEGAVLKEPEEKSAA